MDTQDRSRRDALHLGIVAGALPLLGRAASAAVVSNWPLWVIEADGRKVFLTGETPPRRADWSDPGIERVLDGCATIWNETNHSHREDVGALILRHGVDDGSTLRTRLTDADRKRFAVALAITGLDEKSVDRFRPWLVGQTLDEAYYPKLGFAGRSASTVLVAQAAAAGKTIRSEFAASDDVIAWFGAMTPRQDIDYLRYTLDHIVAGPDPESATFDRWAAGDLSRAAAWIARMKRLYPELYRLIVIDRNRGWVPRVKAALAEDRQTLVVTGLYHLVGPDSVQAQLAAAGLKVRRSAG